MSMLDNGSETVTVYPEETFTDSQGNVVKRPADVGVVVTRVIMQPINSDHDRQRDESVHRDYRLICRNAPLGPWSYVDWNGIRLFVVSGPHPYSASPDTTHITATLRELR